MQQIEGYSQKVRNWMNDYENLIKNSPLYESNRIKWKQLCVELQKKIKNQLLIMRDEMDQLPGSSSFQRTYMDHQSKLLSLSLVFKNKLKIQVRAQSIKKQIPKLQSQPSQQQTSRTIQSVINQGNTQISKMKTAVKAMHVSLQEGIQLAEAINVQLYKQIQQLDAIQDKVKDTGSTLKRANKNINFFVRAAQCDKCLVGLIIAILLALVGFIVLLVKKGA